MKARVALREICCSLGLMSLASWSLQERERELMHWGHNAQAVKLNKSDLFGCCDVVLIALKALHLYYMQGLFASEGFLSKFEVMAYFYHILSLQTHESGTLT